MQSVSCTDGASACACIVPRKDHRGKYANKICVRHLEHELLLFPYYDELTDTGDIERRVTREFNRRASKKLKAESSGSRASGVRPFCRGKRPKSHLHQLRYKLQNTRLHTSWHIPKLFVGHGTGPVTFTGKKGGGNGLSGDEIVASPDFWHEIVI